MNWVGGVRSRIRMQNERRKQKEFFERKRFENKVKRARSPVKNKGVSQDLVSLQIINSLHKDRPQGKEKGKPKRDVIQVDLEKAPSSIIQNLDLDIGPLSPNHRPSKIALLENNRESSKQVPKNADKWKDTRKISAESLVTPVSSHSKIGTVSNTTTFQTPARLEINGYKDHDANGKILHHQSKNDKVSNHKGKNDNVAHHQAKKQKTGTIMTKHGIADHTQSSDESFIFKKPERINSHRPFWEQDTPKLIGKEQYEKSISREMDSLFGQFPRTPIVRQLSQKENVAPDRGYYKPTNNSQVHGQSKPFGKTHGPSKQFDINQFWEEPKQNAAMNNKVDEYKKAHAEWQKKRDMIMAPEDFQTTPLNKYMTREVDDNAEFHQVPKGRVHNRGEKENDNITRKRVDVHNKAQIDEVRKGTDIFKTRENQINNIRPTGNYGHHHVNKPREHSDSQPPKKRALTEVLDDNYFNIQHQHGEITPHYTALENNRSSYDEYRPEFKTHRQLPVPGTSPLEKYALNENSPFYVQHGDSSYQNNTSVFNTSCSTNDNHYDQSNQKHSNRNDNNDMGLFNTSYSTNDHHDHERRRYLPESVGISFSPNNDDSQKHDNRKTYMPESVGLSFLKEIDAAPEPHADRKTYLPESVGLSFLKDNGRHNLDDSYIDTDTNALSLLENNDRRSLDRDSYLPESVGISMLHKNRDDSSYNESRISMPTDRNHHSNFKTPVASQNFRFRPVMVDEPLEATPAPVLPNLPDIMGSQVIAKFSLGLDYESSSDENSDPESVFNSQKNKETRKSKSKKTKYDGNITESSYYEMISPDDKRHSQEIQDDNRSQGLRDNYSHVARDEHHSHAASDNHSQAIHDKNKHNHEHSQSLRNKDGSQNELTLKRSQESHDGQQYYHSKIKRGKIPTDREMRQSYHHSKEDHRAQHTANSHHTQTKLQTSPPNTTPKPENMRQADKPPSTNQTSTSLAWLNFVRQKPQKRNQEETSCGSANTSLDKSNDSTDSTHPADQTVPKVTESSSSTSASEASVNERQHTKDITDKTQSSDSADQDIAGKTKDTTDNVSPFNMLKDYPDNRSENSKRNTCHSVNPSKSPSVKGNTTVRVIETGVQTNCSVMPLQFVQQAQLSDYHSSKTNVYVQTDNINVKQTATIDQSIQTVDKNIAKCTHKDVQTDVNDFASESKILVHDVACQWEDIESLFSIENVSSAIDTKSLSTNSKEIETNTTDMSPDADGSNGRTESRSFQNVSTAPIDTLNTSPDVISGDILVESPHGIHCDHVSLNENQHSSDNEIESTRALNDLNTGDEIIEKSTSQEIKNEITCTERIVNNQDTDVQFDHEKISITAQEPNRAAIVDAKEVNTKDITEIVKTPENSQIDTHVATSKVVSLEDDIQSITSITATPEVNSKIIADDIFIDKECSQNGTKFERTVIKPTDTQDETSASMTEEMETESVDNCDHVDKKSEQETLHLELAVSTVETVIESITDSNNATATATRDIQGTCIADDSNGNLDHVKKAKESTKSPLLRTTQLKDVPLGEVPAMELIDRCSPHGDALQHTKSSRGNHDEDHPMNAVVASKISEDTTMKSKSITKVSTPKREPKQHHSVTCSPSSKEILNLFTLKSPSYKHNLSDFDSEDFSDKEPEWDPMKKTKNAIIKLRVKYGIPDQDSQPTMSSSYEQNMQSQNGSIDIKTDVIGNTSKQTISKTLGNRTPRNQSENLKRFKDVKLHLTERNTSPTKCEVPANDSGTPRVVLNSPNVTASCLTARNSSENPIRIVKIVEQHVNTSVTGSNSDLDCVIDDADAQIKDEKPDSTEEITAIVINSPTSGNDPDSSPVFMTYVKPEYLFSGTSDPDEVKDSDVKSVTDDDYETADSQLEEVILVEDSVSTTMTSADVTSVANVTVNTKAATATTHVSKSVNAANTLTSGKHVIVNVQNSNCMIQDEIELSSAEE